MAGSLVGSTAVAVSMAAITIISNCGRWQQYPPCVWKVVDDSNLAEIEQSLCIMVEVAFSHICCSHHSCSHSKDHSCSTLIIISTR
jgi:hypothetical protein